MGVQGASKPVKPVFTVVVVGIQMMEQMMIAQKPGATIIMTHHATQIEKQENPGNII